LLVALLLLAGCSGGDQTSDVPAEPTSFQIDYAENARPEDAETAAVYDRSCRSCHSLPQSGAPLTGHGAVWQALLATGGMDGLVASTRNGLNGMPAMGLCSDCSDEDFGALIAFMSQEAS
jgi:cytochrome c5